MNALAAILSAACLAAFCLLGARHSGWQLTPPVANKPPGVGREAPAPSPAAGTSAALVADAAAALLSSGTSLPRTLSCLGQPGGPAPELAVVGRLLSWGADPPEAWGKAPHHRGLREALALAEESGAPVALVLAQRAKEERRSKAREEEARAASLAVRLVLPMGLCGLPAFIFLGIVPIGLALAPL